MHVVRTEETLASSEHLATSRAPRRVLVVDDNESFLLTLAAVIRALGHEVRTAPDAAVGLALARDWVPDVVLLDVYLPSRTGFEVARELRRIFPPARMTLVMMSGVDLDEETLKGAGEAGFDRCVGKLMRAEELAELLQSAPVTTAGKYVA